MRYRKPSLFYYVLTQIAAWFFATFVFRRKVLRNEIRGKKGPFVVIANHEAAYDFVNLIGMTGRRMSFVVSNSFYSTLPVRGIMDKIGVIPKQQFQTTVSDMKRIKAVIDNGAPLVIYPAGLMCEDGLSTPIPAATYKFLKWLNADIYVAKTTGTYFAMPKWARGMRPGRTYMDVYRLFTKEELAQTDVQTVRERAEQALRFDAYREQEKYMVRYASNDNLEGLEHVLYLCPHCRTEFSMEIVNRSTIRCSTCGYEQVSDDYAFLHNRSGKGVEYRYVSDWSRMIFDDMKDRLNRGEERELSAETKILMIDPKRSRFTEVGQGVLELTEENFSLSGQVNGAALELTVPIANLPTLPFTPGRHLELQHGKEIYRCVLNDGKLVMKYVNMLKAYYALKTCKES